MIVSVVTVSFNAERDIEKTMRSVLNQTYDSLEYIIIDGGSSDSTMSIVERVSRDYPYKRIIVKSEEDDGIYDAMNKAAQIASGEWICYMNAGDLFYDDLVLDNVFRRDVGNFDVIYGDTRIKENKWTYTKKPLELRCFSQVLPFCHQSSFVKVNILSTVKFDTKFKICADYNFFYQLYMKSKHFTYVPLIISVYDQSNGGFSANNLKRYLYERNKVHTSSKILLWLRYLRTVLALNIYNLKHTEEEKIILNEESLKNDPSVYDIEFSRINK